MESGNRRRTRMVGSVGPVSIWESRMKNDQVNGGIKVDVSSNRRVTKGRNDHPKEKNVVDVITGTNISKSNPPDLQEDNTKDTLTADSSEGRGQGPNNHCISTSSSSKSKDASASPSMGLKKTRSEPPLDKMITNSSPLIRKMKSEPSRALVSSLPNKKVCDSDSDSHKEEEEEVMVVNCTHSSFESSTQPQATGSSSPATMKSIEFNPLGITNVIPKQIENGIEEASSPNPDHDPDFKEAEDKLNLKVKVGDGLKIEAGNSIGANTSLDNIIKENNNNNNNEIKITSVVTAHRSKPQLIKRPSTIITSNGVRKSFPTLKKPTPTPSQPLNNSTNWKESTEQSSDEVCRTPGRFKSVVDLVMWRDVSRTAFVFGIGSFFIISSSYAKDLNISLISGVSYVGLVYLAITFLYRSIMCRGMIDEGDSPVLGEEEAVWMLKLTLPYINELLSNITHLFSGDPALTIKMAFILFVLATCGTSITIFKLIQFGFFGVFVIPKLCSSYSTHMIAYAKFWVERIQDVWQCCSHKKFVAFAIFTLVWNCCSILARAWAVFMLYVGVRYYQQSVCTSAQVEDGYTELQHHQQIHKQRQRMRIIVAQHQNKEKKSF